ncbi:3-deoxy-D-manno-octulosonic acid transferase [Salegentibacter chungangensis]|uniref:3-deoxy-D-manno-octulosonic acid transferase n=1 Tax=Salegentibacter chungangensis TaxID=1335724 RepID=A0ABW3NRL9_9FLAO
MKLFTEGRKEVFSKLEKEITPEDRIIWVHAASLGEFEQAVPVMEMLKEDYQNHRILVTFFSPSGYENKKKHPLADVITYLPLDTPKNARKFLDLAHPELTLFIKYDIWPNFLAELKKRQIRTFLVSGAFRENQVFFKPYGGWMKKALYSFEHFFVQNKKSQELLNSIGFKNVSISGDTRFDRVSRQIEYDNKLEFIEEFLQDELAVVAGSTWPEDDELLIPYINSAPEGAKFIIAPHEIKPEKVKKLQEKIKLPVVLFSEMEDKNLKDHKVLIIDTIGLLSKIYSYADISYVGGAAGNTGLHNILEPATFGIPVIIGKNFDKFPEAKKLQRLAGLFSVSTKEELSQVLLKLIENRGFREKTGMISGHFISSNTGATRTIQSYLHQNP